MTSPRDPPSLALPMRRHANLRQRRQSASATPLSMHQFRATVVAAVIGLAIAAVVATATEDQPAGAGAAIPKDLQTRFDAFTTEIEPLLAQYCHDCHGGGASEGGQTLDALDDPQRLLDHDLWHAVWQNLRTEIMPPSDVEGPTDAERQQIVAWIERDVFGLDPLHPDPGHVTLRRLNREEYRYTIRDLLGIKFNTVELFPPDDTGYGFDTVGDALAVSPLLLEKYLKAAQSIFASVLETRAAADDDSSPYQRIFFDGPPPDELPARLDYQREIFRRFAGRAFRRPVDEATIDRLMTLADAAQEDGDLSFEEATGHGVVAILSSPRFLFRDEATSSDDTLGNALRLDDYSLAARLSYMLWSSLPDEQLLELASRGELRDNLHEEVDRLLADERSERFIENFVGQWLQTRDVVGKHIDARFVLRQHSSDLDESRFSRDVRTAMRAETEMFVGHLFSENRSIDELLTADYTFLNEVLARVYGVPGVEGREMRKVDLPADSHRGGILRHGSLLWVTSNPRRTSPVKRGLFILENLLGTPPPPPPPDVPELQEDRRGSTKGATMRQLMAAHRADPLCASCHARMDPLGLALENYTALGTFRADDQGSPIDTSGELITGEAFRNVDDLASIMVHQRRNDFYRCLVERLFTFAIGRGVEYYDAPEIKRMVQRLDQEEGRARWLIYGIVDSVPFQYRRGDEAIQP